MDTLNFQPKLRDSWLVQRLEQPRQAVGVFADIIDAFSFGGGLQNGGLSKEGMALLKNIFSFDYMGSSEFEWGIVPSCLSFLLNNRKDLVTGTVTIAKDKPTIYYLCHKSHVPEVPARLKLLATKPPRAKEMVRLDDHFRDCKFPTRAVGWLDCSNGFMFFVDKDMFEKTCAMFKVAL